MSRNLRQTSGKTAHGVKFAASATKGLAPKLVKSHLFQHNSTGYVKR